MNILGYDLELTCSACPEQYDVYKDGKQVGYLRLRHGYFVASYLDCGGETVYESATDGDGIFMDDERDRHLFNAIQALDNYIKQINYEGAV